MNYAKQQEQMLRVGCRYLVQDHGTSGRCGCPHGLIRLTSWSSGTVNRYVLVSEMTIIDHEVLGVVEVLHRCSAGV